MRVLVTGSTGFIGSAYCAYLAKLGHSVVRVGRASSRGSDIVYLLDEDESGWASALRDCDTVVHLAGISQLKEDKSLDEWSIFRKSNVDYAVRLAGRAELAGVKRLVFVSSIKVNGSFTPPGGAFSANSIPNPEDFYAKSKLEAENQLLAFSRNKKIEVVIIRPPIVYGCGIKGNLNLLIRWLKKGVPMPLGGIDNRRSLVALENLLSLLALCSDSGSSPQAANRIFLVSDGPAISTSELLQKVASAYGFRLRLFSVPSKLLFICLKMLGQASFAERLVCSLVVDDTETRRVLNWSPPVAMEMQLEMMANAKSL